MKQYFLIHLKNLDFSEDSIEMYTSVEELNRTRDTLKQNGVPTTLIRVRETEQ